MIEQLFGSKTRVKLLKLFYCNPNRSFYVREITRKIDEQINSVRRELSNLLSIGIIVSDTKNNRLYYAVNDKFDYYQALEAIFCDNKLKSKSSSAVNANLEDEIDYKALGQVDLIIYTGLLTKDKDAPVDVLIVGNINKNSVDKFISGIEEDEGMELRFATMTMDQFNYRRQIKDKFATLIVNSKKQVLCDKNHILS